MAWRNSGHRRRLVFLGWPGRLARRGARPPALWLDAERLGWVGTGNWDRPRTRPQNPLRRRCPAQQADGSMMFMAFTHGSSRRWLPRAALGLGGWRLTDTCGLRAATPAKSKRRYAGRRICPHGQLQFVRTRGGEPQPAPLASVLWIPQTLYETICETCGFRTTLSKHFIKCKKVLFIKCVPWLVEQSWYSKVFHLRPFRVSESGR
jgi:hypothetical protein